MPPTRQVTVQINMVAGNTSAIQKAFGNVAQAASRPSTGGVNVLGGITRGAQAVSGGIPAIGSAIAAALGPVGIAIAAVTGAVVALSAAAVHFVGVANPGIAALFTRAWDDAQGVIGQRLIPVVEALTAAFRLFGDFLATILPSTNDFRNALAPLRDIIASIRTELELIGPLIREVLIAQLKLWRLELQALNLVLKSSGLYQIAAVLKEAGLLKPLASSVGAAARPAMFQTGKEYGRAAYLSAYSIGASIDPAKQTADNTAKTATLMEKLIALFGGTPTDDATKRVR
jgi:hypothetical protein